MIDSKTNEIDIIKFQKEIDAAKFTKNTEFISKEKATANLKIDLGEDFVEFLGYSPLLASIDVKLNADYANNDSLTIIDSLLRQNNIVHDVFYQEDLVEKLNHNVNRISAFLLSFCLGQLTFTRSKSVVDEDKKFLQSEIVFFIISSNSKSPLQEPILI